MLHCEAGVEGETDLGKVVHNVLLELHDARLERLLFGACQGHHHGSHSHVDHTAKTTATGHTAVSLAKCHTRRDARGEPFFLVPANTITSACRAKRAGELEGVKDHGRARERGKGRDDN